MPLQDTPVKSILNKKKKRESWFLDDYTINPYSGCSFNCLYCYIRGSKYGEHMEEKVSVKADALEILEKQLAMRARKQQFGFIVLGSATDPYLHFEEETKLSRGMLELILKYRFPVHVITKSPLIERDFDLLHEINTMANLPMDLAQKMNDQVVISFSFSTIDEAVAKIFEPGAPNPLLRLSTLKHAVDAGFRAGVSMMPLLPYISDTTDSLHAMFGAFKDAGARYILPSTITLFGNDRADSRTLMFRAVQKHYPHLQEKYERLLGASDYLPRYYNDAFHRKAMELCDEYGIRFKIVD